MVSAPARRAVDAADGHLAVLRHRLDDSIVTKQRLLADAGALSALAAVAVALVRCARGGHTVFFFGNGGSSTDAQHLAAELVGRFGYDRPPLAALCLSDSSAAITAIGNDYGYDEVFARQLEGLARPGDVAVGFSTSGRSPNIVAAMRRVDGRGVTRVAMTGSAPSPLGAVVEHHVAVPSTDTPRIQECHLLVGHILCEIVERETFPRG